MTKFSVSDIVSLKNHPYFNLDSEILISANDELIPPAMVVIEVLGDKSKPDFDPNTGVRGTSKIQVKCVFYSHKNYRFESHWFNESQLKRIGISEDDSVKFLKISKLQDINDYLEKNVILKTWKLEIIKKKLSLSYLSSSTTKSHKVNALMSFLPPVMTIIGCKKIEEKTNNFDKKTGNPKRKFSSFLVKCKWYNPNSGVFSEDFFSPYSLNVIPEINIDLLQRLQMAIKDKEYLNFNNKDIQFNDGNTIGLPKEIIFNHCYYKLSYFDYITNQIETISLQKYSIKDFSFKKIYFKEIVPKFTDLALDTDVIDFLSKELPNPLTRVRKAIWRITYLDMHDEKSQRTVTLSKLYYNGDKNDFKNNTVKDEKKYLQSKCFKRNGEKRYFKFDRIQKIEVLDI